MQVIRRIGCVIIVAAAAVVFFVVSPQAAVVGVPGGHDSEISEAESNFASNNSSAQYVYGQIDAASVAAKDNLAIIARQLDQQAVQQSRIASAVSRQGPDRRVPAELALAIALLGWLGLTAPRAVIQVSPISPGPIGLDA